MVVDLSEFKVDVWVDFRLEDSSVDLICKVCEKGTQLPSAGTDLQTLVMLAIKHQHIIKAPV